jgi:SanA protein
MAETKAGGAAKRWLRRLVRAALALVVAAALALAAANLGVRRAARSFVHHPAAGVTAPVVIVPGASVHRDGSPSPQLADRLETALGLVRAGQVKHVLVSGARDGAYDEAAAMRRWLIQRGVPREAIAGDPAGFRTLDTMERAARVFGVKRAVVCTQAFHLPRAVFLARRAGIEAVGVVADRRPGNVRGADHVREAVATLLAVVDSYVLRRQPRVLGPPQPLARTDAGR